MLHQLVGNFAYVFALCADVCDSAFAFLHYKNARAKDSLGSPGGILAGGSIHHPQARKIPLGVFEAFLRVVQSIARKPARFHWESLKHSCGWFNPSPASPQDSRGSLGGILAGGPIHHPQDRKPARFPGESSRHSCGWFVSSPARPQARKIPWESWRHSCGWFMIARRVLGEFLRVVHFVAPVFIGKWRRSLKLLTRSPFHHPQECLQDSPGNLAGLRVMD